MTSSDPADAAFLGHGAARATEDGSAVPVLPTLQRNALRKLLDRPDFTPAEVAALGFRRLQLTRGLGRKGLDNVLAWLRHHGHDLEPLPTRCADGGRRNQRIERAIHLLESQGFVVLPCSPSAGSESGGTGPAES